MTMLKTKNVVTLTDLQRSPSRAVRTAVSTRESVVITQHGRPAVVMMDCETFERFGADTSAPQGPDEGISERERALRDELLRILLLIVARYKPEKIILFGSLAKGGIGGSSDIDLVIIKKTKKRYWDRMREILSIVRPRLACDMFVYTPKEWKKALEEGRSFATHEMNDRGKVVYERAA